LALVGLASVAAVVSPTVSGRSPARLLVYAQEWSLWPSRTSLPAGRVTVQLWNRGEDPHDLHIRRLNSRGRMIGHSQRVGSIGSGAIGQATWHVGKGRYELYCSLPGHLRRGMHTRIVVK
jgi:hypothetical protein